MKSCFKKVLTYFAIFLFFTVLCLLCFQLPLKHILPVYTYRGIFIILLISFLLLLTLVLLKRFLPLNIDKKDIIIIFLLFAFVHLLFFCMVPVTIERSFSVLMLSEMSKQENQVLDLESTENIFMQTYIQNNNALQKRFDEQLATGITSIDIPNSVTYIGENAFRHWDETQTINCDFTSKPEEWDSNWAAYDYDRWGSASTEVKVNVKWKSSTQ